jgi:hypothetical protein
MENVITSGPAATPGDGIYGQARGLRLTTDEQAMLADMKQHYGEKNASQVLRIALRHLYDSVTAPSPVAAPEPAIS